LHVHHIANQDKVNVCHRWDAGDPRDDVVVIANFAHRGLSFYKVGLPAAVSGAFVSTAIETATVRPSQITAA
jgi:hypothetical protein